MSVDIPKVYDMTTQEQSPRPCGYLTCCGLMARQHTPRVSQIMEFCRVYIIRPNFTSILKIFALLFDWNVLGLTNLDIGFVFDVFWYVVIQRRAFPIRTDCDTIFLNVVARCGTVRWNRHITPDLCLAISWLHDLINTDI
jgi:hypothetical protein